MSWSNCCNHVRQKGSDCNDKLRSRAIDAFWAAASIRGLKHALFCAPGKVPLAVYAFGIFLPAIVAFLRDELMLLLGVPAYTLLFRSGPFASAAAVFWSKWSVGWRAAWVLLAPVLAATNLGLLLVAVS